MCTVSWRSAPGVLEIFCNRDEKKSRAMATPPRLAAVQDRRYIAPADPEGGGSWIAVNDCGICVALLNYYDKDQAGTAGPFTSRGKLVTSLMARISQAAMEPVFNSDYLQPYRPFMLLTFQPGSLPHKYTWDGTTCWKEERHNPIPLVTTSSYLPEEVIGQRLRTYADAVPSLHHPSADQLRAFHAGHVPERGPFSVCMHRDDAHTVSFSHVQIRPDRISFTYHPGPPCVPDDSTTVVHLDPV